jgi:hypothetical protein
MAGSTGRAFGDVEIVVVHLDDGLLGSAVLDVLLRQVEAGRVRLLDMVLVHRSADGRHRLAEVDRHELALTGLELSAPGVGDDDARHFAARMPAGSSLALILVEPTGIEGFVRDLRRRGSRVVTTEAVPAVIANAVWRSAAESD